MCVQVPNKKKNIKEEILFWGCCSIEHIEVILDSNGVFELKVPSEIKRELVDISEELIGCGLPECTPQAFFDTREHIVYEQRYYNDILEKILAVLG